MVEDSCFNFNKYLISSDKTVKESSNGNLTVGPTAKDKSLKTNPS